MSSTSTFTVYQQIQKNIATRKAVAERVRELKKQNITTKTSIPDKKQQKTKQLPATLIKSIDSTDNSNNVESCLQSFPEKHLLETIVLEEAKVQFIDEAHLKNVHKNVGLEIVYSRNRKAVHFLINKTAENIVFDELDTDKHLLCRAGEILLARPHNTILHKFRGANDRLAIHKGENLLFSKKI
jgi:hypothetical protein